MSEQFNFNKTLAALRNVQDLTGKDGALCELSDPSLDEVRGVEKPEGLYGGPQAGLQGGNERSYRVYP